MLGNLEALFYENLAHCVHAQMQPFTKVAKENAPTLLLVPCRTLLQMTMFADKSTENKTKAIKCFLEDVQPQDCGAPNTLNGIPQMGVPTTRFAGLHKANSDCDDLTTERSMPCSWMTKPPLETTPNRTSTTLRLSRPIHTLLHQLLYTTRNALATGHQRTSRA